MWLMIYCCRCWWKTTHAHAQNWRHYRCIRWFARENARDWQNTKEQLDDLWTSARFSAWNPIPIGDQSPRNIQTQFTNLSRNSNDQNCSLIDRSGSARMSSSRRQLRQFQVFSLKEKEKKNYYIIIFFSGIAKKSSRNPSYSEAQMSTSPKTCLENSENIVTNWPNSWERLVLLEMNSNWSFDRNFFSSHIIISSLLRTTIFLLSWPTGNVETLFFDQFIFLFRMFKTFLKIFEKRIEKILNIWYKML